MEAPTSRVTLSALDSCREPAAMTMVVRDDLRGSASGIDRHAVVVLLPHQLTALPAAHPLAHRHLSGGLLDARPPITALRI
jgi:hypothetical protein